MNNENNQNNFNGANQVPNIQNNVNGINQVPVAQDNSVGEYIDVNLERNKIEDRLSSLEAEQNKELSQAEHDENINSETKVNEAGKKEVRIKVDERVSRVHEKDRFKASLLIIVLIVVPIVLLVHYISQGISSNEEEAFEIKVIKSAKNYMEKDAQASLVYAFYMEKIDSYYLFVSDLVDAGEIDYSLVNPKTKESMNNSVIYVYMKDGELEYNFPYQGEAEKLELIRSAKVFVNDKKQAQALNALKTNAISRIPVSVAELKASGYVSYPLSVYNDSTLIVITYKYDKLMFSFE